MRPQVILPEERVKQVLIERYGTPWEVARCVEVPDVGAPGADPTETDAGLVRAFSPSGALRQAIAPAAGTYCAGAGSRLAAGPGFLAVGIVDCFGEAAVLGFSR